MILVRSVYAVFNIFSDVYQTAEWGTSGTVEYKLKPALTFQDAKQACANEGASLPIVSSEDENQSLVTLLQSLSKVHMPFIASDCIDLKIETIISKFCSESCLARDH